MPQNPRRGIENHMWPLVLRLLDSTELGWPASIAGISEREIRAEVESTFVATLANHLMIAIGCPIPNFSTRPADVARRNLNANPSLKEPLEYYELAHRRERTAHRRLDEFERRLMRERIFLEECDEGRGGSPISLCANSHMSRYLPTSKEPRIVDALNLWNRLSAEYHVSENGYAMAKANLEHEIERSKFSSSQQKMLPWQLIWETISHDTLSEEPLHAALKDLNAWWTDFCFRATGQLATDCQSKGHYLTLRQSGFDHLYQPESASAFRKIISNAHAEKRFFKDYLLTPHWFAGADDEHGKRENRSWNLPQLKQQMLRQDVNVDRWMNKRGGRSNPNHPAHRRQISQTIQRKREDAETRLLWLLIRDGVGDSLLSNFHANHIDGQEDYPDGHFVEVILKFEAQLIAFIPDAQTREFRMGEVRDRLRRAFPTLAPQFLENLPTLANTSTFDEHKN